MRGEVRAGRKEGMKRTWNMPCMVVTLGVSRLSGWLNADAPCQVERREYEAGRDVRCRAGERT